MVQSSVENFVVSSGNAEFFFSKSLRRKTHLKSTKSRKFERRVRPILSRFSSPNEIEANRKKRGNKSIVLSSFFALFFFFAFRVWIKKFEPISYRIHFAFSRSTMTTNYITNALGEFSASIFLRVSMEIRKTTHETRFFCREDEIFHFNFVFFFVEFWDTSFSERKLAIFLRLSRNRNKRNWSYGVVEMSTRNHMTGLMSTMKSILNAE